MLLLLLLLSRFSRVRLRATSWTAAYQASPSMGFSRQEYWSGVPPGQVKRNIKLGGKVEAKQKVLCLPQWIKLCVIKGKINHGVMSRNCSK